MRILLGLFILLLSGCSSIPFLAAANDKLLSGVTAYCARSIESRLIDQGAVNAALQGRAKVQVWCAGDPAVDPEVAVAKRKAASEPASGPWMNP